jgi:hypothetical protein
MVKAVCCDIADQAQSLCDNQHEGAVRIEEAATPLAILIPPLPVG